MKKITFLLAWLLSWQLVIAQGTVYQHQFTTGAVSGSDYTTTPDVLASGLSVGSPQWTGSGTTSISSCSGNNNLSFSVPNLGVSRTLTLTLNVLPAHTLNLTGISTKVISGINNGGYSITVNGNAYYSSPLILNACPGITATQNTPLTLTGTVTIVVTATNSGTGTQSFAIDDFTLQGSISSTAVYLHQFTTGAVTGSDYTTTPDVIASGLSVGSPQWAGSGTTSISNCSGNNNLSVSVPNLGVSRTLTLTLNVASGYILNLSGISTKVISGINNGGYSITVNGNAYYSSPLILNACPGITVTQNTPLTLTGTVTIVVTATNSGTSTQSFAIDDFIVSGNVSLAANTLNNLGFSNSDPKAVAAYSLRQLSTAYTGPMVRVTIGANTYDVWPDVSGTFSMSSVISTANPSTIPGTKNGATTLSTVATGNTATIAIWYNQVNNSNSNNVSQSTVAQQPRIINSGVIEMQNGRPSAYFNGASSQSLNSTSSTFINFGTGASLLSVFSKTGSGAGGIFSLTSSVNNYFNIWSGSATNVRFESGISGTTIQSTTQTISTSALYQQTCISNEHRINGGSLLTGSASGLMNASFDAQFVLGSYVGYWTGYLSEVVCFPLNLNATERQLGENNQLNYYLSSDANLSAMTISSGTLAPSFAAATTTYTASVANGTTSITVTSTKADANASIQVRVNSGTYAAVASGSPSSALTLNVGSNTIDVKVTAQDGATIKTYTITVTRAASTNADLSAMTISSGTLTPSFAAATTTYTASVTNGTTSITVTPTKADANATIEVRVNSGTYATIASGSPSSALSLNVGANTIDVKVTAQDGSTIKTYTTTVTRATGVAVVPPGNALNFDGTNDFVQTTANGSTVSTNFSVEAWVNPNHATNTITFISTREPAEYTFDAKLDGGNKVLVDIGNGASWGIGNSGLLSFNYNYTVGKWMHVAIAVNSTTCSLYINGILIETKNHGIAGPTLLISTSFIKIGSVQGVQFFDGRMDEVRVWNTTRTATDIQNNFRDTVASNSAGLLAYYRFDVGTAGGTNTGSTTLANEVGSGLTGTLTNFALTGSTSNWVESYAMAIPTASAATSVSSTGFTANWTAPLRGVIDNNYRLYVSADTTFATGAIPGSPFTVTGTSQAITGLSAGTKYFYRVVADKTSVTGQGGYSATITITTAAFTSPPTITNFTPISAKPGDVVTFTGTNFNTTPANNIVLFGATRATVTAATATSATVTVPTGATYAPITLLNTGTLLACASNARFNPIYSPAKSGITANDFSPKQDFATGSTPHAVAVGDFDGDGKADIAVANVGTGANSVSVFRNTGTSGNINSSSFAAKQDFTTGDNARSVSIGDFDGDGKADIAVANVGIGANSVSVLRNTSTSGAINFASKIDIVTGAQPTSTAIDDIDGDGKLDLVVANYGSNTVSLLRNTSTLGNISFAAKVDSATGTQPYHVSTGDLDGDGKKDIIVANALSANFSVLRNNSTVGAFNFEYRINIATASTPNCVAVGDLDGDGKLDIAISNYWENNVAVFRNTATIGNINFAAKLEFTTGTQPHFVAIGDLDGDGKPDLMVPNSGSNTLSVFRNVSTGVGNINMASKVDFTTGNSPVPGAIADLDGDSRLDLVVANYNGNNISVLRNADIVMDPPGNAITLDGIDDKINLPVGLTNDTQSQSVEFWVKINGTIPTGDRKLYIRGEDGFGAGWSNAVFVSSNGKLNLMNCCSAPGNGLISGSTTVVPNRWYHVAAVFNAGNNTQQLYVNGNLEGSNASWLPFRNSTIGYQFGRGNGNEWINESVDEIRVWTKALTQSEIQAGMYDTIPKNSANLVAYYKLDQGVAGGTNTTITSALNQVNNTYDATLTNVALTGSTSNWVESYAMAVPTATAATSVSSTGFTANWTAPLRGVVDNSYRLYVSTDTTFATGAIAGSPFTVAGTSQAITGLSAGTKYFYRVVADKTSVTGQGGFSSTITVTTTSVLPLTLLSFHAAKTGEQVTLNWQTTNEINTSHFNVQVSVDGNSWTNAGIINSRNVNGINNYSFIHTSLVKGSNYYRLQLVDKDAKFTYSEIRRIDFKAKGNDLLVYPNPVKSGLLNINLGEAIYQSEVYRITTIDGKMVQQGIINNRQQTINIGLLSAGTYLLKVGGRKVVKLMKQ